MLRAGIFLDMENLRLNGGYGLRFDIVRKLVEAQQTIVVRANAYITIDNDRYRDDEDYRNRRSRYVSIMKREGFRPFQKVIRRYKDYETGETLIKANADLDMAVETMLQSDALDYILLGTGDGDFLRLVRALQTRGKRVDLLSFCNTHRELREEVDNHFNGFIVPGLIPSEGNERHRGILNFVGRDKRNFSFGKITTMFGLRAEEMRDDVFLHIRMIRDCYGYDLTDDAFNKLKEREAILEFDLQDTDKGLQAINAVELLKSDLCP